MSISSGAVEAVLASCARTIAGAKSDIRLRVFENQISEVAGLLLKHRADRHLVVDGLYELAVANKIVEQYGDDFVQRMLAAAFQPVKTSDRTAGKSTAPPPANIGRDPAAPGDLTRTGKAALHFDLLADVAPQPINWLWEGRLAKGKLTLIAGDPGLGKSQITADTAARLSIGSEWPDGGRAPSVATIILSAEDGIADTLRPRLEVAGADLARVHALRAVLDERGGRRSFSLQADLALLGDKLEQVGDVGLIVVDPVTSYMGKIDSHRTTDVRAVLEPLAEFAERHAVAILAITHPPKATQAKAMHAITGSLAFVAAARLVFLAVEDTESDRRLLLPVKSNIGVLAPGLGFSLIAATTASGIASSKVYWDGCPVTVTANQALHAAAEHAKGDENRTEADEFLREALAKGPVKVKEIERQADELGITKRTLARARKRLGVDASKSDYQGGWVLSMPASR